MSQSDNTTKIVGIAGTALMGLMGNFFYDKVIADKEAPVIAPPPQVQVVFVPQPNNTVVPSPSPTTDNTAQFVSVNDNIPEVVNTQTVATDLTLEKVPEPMAEQEYKLVEPNEKAPTIQRQEIVTHVKPKPSNEQSVPIISKSKKTELDPVAVRVLNVAFQIEGDSVKVDWRATNKSGVPLGKQQFKAVFYDGINSSGQILGEYASREFEKPLGPCGSLPYKERFQAPPNMKSIQIQTVSIKPLIAGQTDSVQHCY
jgi:hypothetical protein